MLEPEDFLSITNALEKKGYDLVGTNQNGNNAFFVRKQIVIDRNLEKFTPEECFHYNTFSEIIDKISQILLSFLILCEIQK